MASFTPDGVTSEYLVPDPGHVSDRIYSWTYGQYRRS